MFRCATARFGASRIASHARIKAVGGSPDSSALTDALDHRRASAGACSRPVRKASAAAAKSPCRCSASARLSQIDQSVGARALARRNAGNASAGRPPASSDAPSSCQALPACGKSSTSLRASFSQSRMFPRRNNSCQCDSEVRAEWRCDGRGNLHLPCEQFSCCGLTVTRGVGTMSSGLVFAHDLAVADEESPSRVPIVTAIRIDPGLLESGRT